MVKNRGVTIASHESLFDYSVVVELGEGFVTPSAANEFALLGATLFDFSEVITPSNKVSARAGE